MASAERPSAMMKRCRWWLAESCWRVERIGGGERAAEVGAAEVGCAVWRRRGEW